MPLIGPRKTLWTEFGDALVERDGMICVYCERPVFKTSKVRPNQATIDHLIPKCKGGRTALDNLAICCNSCNNEKGDGDFVTQYHRKRIERAINQRKRIPQNSAKIKGLQE